MNRDTFIKLCDAVKPYIQKQNTNFRNAIPVEKRVAVALTVLKGNIDFWTIADLFGIGKSTVGHLLREFCAAVIVHFKDIIKFPDTEEERKKIAERFEQKWQFYDCFGAMDGVHIPVLPPFDQSEQYYNYKGFHSINVLAITDDMYQFIYAVFGAPGRCNDPSILRQSELFDLFNNSGNRSPKISTNFHIISDAAFPLMTWIMKPYTITIQMPAIQKNFNYRLSSARMCIENSFGRLKGRWRILSRRPDVHIDTMRYIIKTCFILHNFAEKCKQEVPDQWIRDAEMEETNFLNAVTAQPNDFQIEEPDLNDGNSECVSAKLKRIKLSEKLFSDKLSVS